MRAVGLGLIILICGCPGGGAGEPVVESRVEGWLYTSGNRIERADGSLWQGRGVNIHDTRSCLTCVGQAPDVSEVKRRIDLAVDDWGATFLRLSLEAYAEGNGATSWRSLLDDPSYREAVESIVDYAGTKPGVYIMVSVWMDPSLDANGWPTAETAALWARLASMFRDAPHVLFGVAHEPRANTDGAQDVACAAAMSAVVEAIREVERGGGGEQHIVAVQGTRAFGRSVHHYIDHPITAGGGENIAYEVHLFDPLERFDELVGKPASHLPIIIGAFGPPTADQLGYQDALNLMLLADGIGVSYSAWSLHHACGPNLLKATAQGCGMGMSLEPSAWGEVVRAHLSE
jgi:hypothetical protein